MRAPIGYDAALVGSSIGAVSCSMLTPSLCDVTYDRIFSELPDVPFRDHVWPKFLRENAKKVFKLP